LSQNQRFFETISAEQKLSHGEVHSILCDSQGFMWFGTQNGLNRWDGYKMLTFHNIPDDSLSLSYNTVRALFEDSQGNLWVGTSGGGLNCFNRDNNTFERFDYNPKNKNGIANKNVYSIFEDSQHNLWIGTYGGGLQLFDYKTKTFTTYKHSYTKLNSIVGNSIRSIAEDSSSNLWIACDGDGISSFNLKTKKFTSYSHDANNKNSLCSNATLSIFVDSDSSIYIGTWLGGISVFNPKKNEFKTIKHIPQNENSLSSNEVFSIFKDENNLLWFSTRKGVDVYNKEKKTFQHNRSNEFNNNSITNDFITYITKDNTGGIWVATGGGGVCKTNVKGYNFGLIRRNPLVNNTLMSQNVQCFASSKNNKLWIGTSKGVQLYDSANCIFEEIDLQIKDFPKEYFVKSIVEDKNGDLWIGTEGLGLIYYSPLTHTSIQYSFVLEKNSLTNNSIICMKYDSVKHEIWIGTYGGGLDKFIIEKKEFENYPINAFVEIENVVNDIELISPNEILVATISNGLMVLNTDFKIFQSYGVNKIEKEKFGKISAIDIYKSDSLNLWIAAAEGIYNYNNNILNYYKFPSNYNGVVASSIQIDDSSRLWISSSQGLFLFNTKIKAFDANFVNNGIQSYIYNQRSSINLADGSMYFGGQKGINFFNPNNLFANDLPGKLVFTEYWINRKKVGGIINNELDVAINKAEHLHIPSNANSFSVEFAYLHFQSSKDNKYRYRLLGYSDDWFVVNSNNRIAHYSKLPYGEYELQVQAANCDGIWQYEIIKLKIFVDVPFWEKTWFYLLLLFVLILIIGAYIFLRERVNKNKRELLEAKIKAQNKVKEQKQDLEKLYVELQSQNEEVMVQDEYLHNVIEELQRKNQMVRHSFKYAERIQHAMLAKENDLHDFFSDIFVMYKPKDIVSGDFYWFTQEYDTEQDCNAYIFASVDCTGHGVPGAFLTIVSRFLLDKVIKHQKVLNPSEILQELNKNVLAFFSQSVGAENNDDGMDITVCRVCTKHKKFIVASAMQKYAVNSVENGFNVYDGDLFSIGDVFSLGKNPKFENRVFDYKEGDTLYFFSDGYADQFGGPNNTKFMETNLFSLLEKNSLKDMDEQKRALEKKLNWWQGGKNQLDDIMIVGLKI